MSVERELDEGLKRAAELERKLFERAKTLDEQASILKNEVGGTGERVEQLAKHCLLSEICGVLDFDRMVEAREHFQEEFPEHFTYYLANLESIGWQMVWPGCLECANFEGSCSLGMQPVESTDSRNRFDRQCDYKQFRG